MKKSSIAALTILILGIMTLGTVAQEIKWQPAPKTIDIGSAQELTGGTALTGHITKCAHDIAVERVNKEGGINGIPMRLLHEDCKGTNPGTLAVVNKAIYDQKVYAAFITVRSTINHAVHPLILQAKIPALYGGSAISVRELGNPWMFGVRTNDRNCAGIMAKFMVENLGHKKVASIYSDEAFGQGGNDETVKWLKELYGIEPLTVQRFARGTKDYTAQLLAIKETGATCIFSWSANSEDDGIILRQVKQLGLDVDFVGGNSYGSIDVTVKIAGQDAEGIYAIVDFSPEDQRPIVQWYIDEMKTRYNLPGGGGTPWSYDGTLILADAMRRAGIVKEIDGKKMIMPLEQAREAIRVALSQTKDFGPDQGATKVYTADKLNDLAHSMLVVRIKDGRHEIVDVVEVGI